MSDSDSVSTRAPVLFLVPFYGDQERSREYLEETIAGFFRQTDPNWHALIVDDATPDATISAHVRRLADSHPNHLSVLRLASTQGIGGARNAGYEWAAEHGYELILLNDADDVSHERRVEVSREIFCRDEAVGMVYTRFITIDEHGDEVKSGLIATNKDSLAMFESNPVRGFGAWIRIATDAGSVGLPSATAVRTAAAVRCPSPVGTPSEAAAQWMHISAAGYKIEYTPDIPTFYRVTSSVHGSTHHRRRLGERTFYENFIRVRTEGFQTAVDTAIERGDIREECLDSLWLKYRLRLADNLYKVGQAQLADGVLAVATRDAFPALWQRVVDSAEEGVAI
jgi:hypothetical protein